ncbi:hypothetical protein E3E12_06595 [Formicincola oecophyllae]|uniref:Uncharacterized protein n=1 Tax=Formicincola oecophyllae TaxID=2558361 RepID=A0A4Y6UBQ6_9PROT|nr:hypothetical protein [Formicincola oecophyllae]QDH13906.1 hypothetical protein E3E12_06595 [Formicincola oecophyllae]
MDTQKIMDALSGFKGTAQQGASLLDSLAQNLRQMAGNGESTTAQWAGRLETLAQAVKNGEANMGSVTKALQGLGLAGAAAHLLHGDEKAPAQTSSTPASPEAPQASQEPAQASQGTEAPTPQPQEAAAHPTAVGSLGPALASLAEEYLGHLLKK